MCEGEEEVGEEEREQRRRRKSRSRSRRRRSGSTIRTIDRNRTNIGSGTQAIELVALARARLRSRRGCRLRGAEASLRGSDGLDARRDEGRGSESGRLSHRSARRLTRRGRVVCV